MEIRRGEATAEDEKECYYDEYYGEYYDYYGELCENYTPISLKR